jgi:hypothetical protein
MNRPLPFAILSLVNVLEDDPGAGPHGPMKCQPSDLTASNITVSAMLSIVSRLSPSPCQALRDQSPRITNPE